MGGARPLYAGRSAFPTFNATRSFTRPGTRAGPRCASMRLRRSASEIWLPPVRPAARCKPSSLLR
jgi:hypothetical protein